MAKKMTARLLCAACRLPRNGVIAVIATLTAKMRSIGRLTAHSLTTFVQGVTPNCGSLKVTKSYIQPKKSLRRKAAEHSVHWTGRHVALIAKVNGISFFVLSVGIASRPASNANRSTTLRSPYRGAWSPNGARDTSQCSTM